MSISSKSLSNRRHKGRAGRIEFLPKFESTPRVTTIDRLKNSRIRMGGLAIGALVTVVGLGGTVGDYLKSDRDGTVEIDRANTADGSVLYEVKSGDNPWNIVHKKLGYEVDTRAIVDDILEQAGRDGEPGLQPGEQIALPPHDN